MQRIIRTNDAFAQSNAAADEKLQMLTQFCPPHLLSLFAIPRKGQADILEWWSPLGGQPQPMAALSHEQQQELLNVYEHRQQTLTELAEQLTAKQQPAAAEAIHSLLGQPNLNQLYSIDNQPVLINWDSEPPVKPAPPVVPVTPVVAATTAATAVVAKRRLWPWLLALFLLLLLLALLAWWLYCNTPKTAPVEPVAPVVVEPVKKPEPTSEPSIEPKPVVAPKPEPESKPEPEPVKAEPVKPIPEPKPEPVKPLPEPKPEVVKPKPAPPKPPRKFNNIDNFACTPNPKQPPPEFVVVFDTSGSMNERYPGSSKSYLDVSKEAFGSMIRNLHPRIDTRLIYFTGWCGTKDAGVFTGNQRAELTQRVNQLKLGIGTPITPGLLDAASKINGKSRDALIVLFIDGAGNCGENVCAVAQRLARMKPRLQINVVDITGTGEAQCIAQATKGRVYTPKNVNQMNTQLLDATKEIGKQCKQ